MKQAKQLILAVLVTVSLVGCGKNSAGTSGSDNPANPTSTNTQTEEPVVLTSVVIQNKSALENKMVGDAGKVEAVALPESVNQVFTYVSDKPEIVEIKKSGRFTCNAPGVATITVTCVDGDITKFDSVTINVKDTFFEHNSGWVDEPDFTHELDEEDPYVIYKGSGYLAYKECFATKWYAQADLSIMEMMYGEVWGKVGFQSVDEECINGFFYYFDCPLGFTGADKCWNAIGCVDEISGRYHGEFDYDIKYNIPRTQMNGKAYLAYEDVFTMGMLRDGADYYVFWGNECVYKMTSTYLDATAPSFPSVTGNNVKMTVSSYSYIKEDMEGWNDVYSKAQNFGK